MVVQRPRLTQVQIRNYKNIAAAVVNLQPVTVLVGPNGAGKSNFVDALSFSADSLSHSIHYAFKERGGIASVRRKSGGHPPHIGFRFTIAMPDDVYADYSFEIAARQKQAFVVAHERCVVQRGPLPLLGQPERRVEFEVANGAFTREMPGIRPKVEPDRLALTILSATEEFRPVYDFLTGIRCYSLRPERVRELQDADPQEGSVLSHDGSNAGAVLRRIIREEAAGSSTGTYERICALLAQVVPGTTKVEPRSLGRQETLEFFQDVGQKHEWRFPAFNMSDGTLRVLGILLAVYQTAAGTLIAIEEPEATVHPAAAEVITDILLDGTERSQVVFTTHSPDVLDNKRLTDDQIIVVESQKGVAMLTPLTKTTRDIIKQRLYTPGELLRMGELRTDPEYPSKAADQLGLFGSVGDR